MADLNVAPRLALSTAFDAYTISLNGDVKYVGITTRGVSSRWYNHVYDAYMNQRCRLIGRKYGEDNLVCTHVACAVDENSLSELEVILIRQYDTFNNGCNLTSGGQKDSGLARKAVPE